jgi:zinc protease
MIKKLVTSFVVLVGLLLSPLHAGIFNHHVFTLQNGMKVYFIENKLAPVISVHLYYHVGTADDPVAEIGLSHFLEHMMFKGTKNISKEHFENLVIQQGGSFNAMTSTDLTVYLTDIAKDQLELILFLEADRMKNLSFTKEEVESERKVVLEERLMRQENNPFGQAQEIWLKSLYWHHPYGVTPIGYAQHINRYSYESVRKHYETYYAPNNATLIICGDADFENIKKLTEKYFGQITPSTLPKRERTPEPSHQGTTIDLTHEHQRIDAIHINLAYNAPTFKSDNKEHAFPLYVLVQILTGNQLSRWVDKFVEQEKVLGSINCDYDLISIDPQAFTISMSLLKGMKPDVIRKKIEKEIEILLQKGITEEELKNAKRDLLANRAFAKDGLATSVQTFSAVVFGYSPDDIEKEDEIINAITVDDVNKAAQFLFSQKPLASLTIYPKTTEVKEKK